jgi:hAT family C-terminal dimerisation region
VQAPKQLSPSHREEMMSELMSDDDDDEPIETPDTAFDLEWENYMMEPEAGLDDDELDWWRRNGAKFPMLKVMARKYLTILAATAVIESLFSRAKFWCRAERSSISGRKLDVITTLSSAISEHFRHDSGELDPAAMEMLYNIHRVNDKTDTESAPEDVTGLEEVEYDDTSEEDTASTTNGGAGHE